MARVSWVNRETAEELQWRSERRTLTASRRWSPVSSTSYTSANPPRPIIRTTR